jgi:hypothetical protein
MKCWAWLVPCLLAAAIYSPSLRGRIVRAIVTLIDVQLELAQAHAQASDAAASQAYLVKARVTAQHLAQLERAMGEATLMRIAQAEQSLRAPRTPFRANPGALDSRERHRPNDPRASTAAQKPRANQQRKAEEEEERTCVHPRRKRQELNCDKISRVDTVHELRLRLAAHAEGVPCFRGVRSNSS